MKRKLNKYDFTLITLAENKHETDENKTVKKLKVN